MDQPNPHTDIQRPGDYILPNIILVSHTGKSIEMKEMVIEMNIYESIYKNAVTGTLVILDTTNLIQNLPIQGTERLVFKLSTPGTLNNSNLTIDATETTGNPFHIYKISDRQELKEGVESYLIHFCSREYFRNMRTKVSKAYNGELSSSVVQIYTDEQKLDGKKQLKIEPTRNSDKIVMPNIRPFDAINMLATKALSKNGKSAGYLFYETTKAFYFRSIESMLATLSVFPRDEEIEVNYSPKNVGDGGGVRTASNEYNLYNVDNYSFDQHFDTATNTMAGTYGSNVILHNLYDKSYNITSFNFHDSFHEEYHADKVGDRGSQLNYPVSRTPISLELTDDGSRQKAISDYPDSSVSLMPTTRYLHGENTGMFGTSLDSEGYTEARKISRTNQTNNTNILRIELPGHSYLEAGDVIKFNLPSQEPRKGIERGTMLDEYYSGRYIIAKLRHQVAKEGYSMILECIKDSVSNAYGDENVYPGVEQKSPKVVDLYEDEQGRTSNTKINMGTRKSSFDI